MGAGVHGEIREAQAVGPVTFRSPDRFVALWRDSRRHLAEGIALSDQAANEADEAVRGLRDECGLSRPAIARLLRISPERVKQIDTRSARAG